MSYLHKYLKEAPNYLIDKNTFIYILYIAFLKGLRVPQTLT